MNMQPSLDRSAPVDCFPFDDLEERAGYVAAEANHAKDKKLQKELRRLFARIEALLESHGDEHDGSAE
jgi:hypothetical protein